MENSLLKLTEIDKLGFLQYGWLYFEFNELSKIDTSSMLIYLNNQKRFNSVKFLDWLKFRNINYTVKFIYQKNQSLMLNIKAYFYYLKLKRIYQF